MRLRTAILLLSVTAGTAWAQNPDVIQDTRSTLQNVQKKQTNDQNAVLNSAGMGQASSTKPATPAAASAAPSAKAKPATAAVKSSPKAAASPATQEKKAEAAKPAEPKPEVAVEDKKNPPDPKKPEKTYSAEGKRDPFVSPVVTRSVAGTGCSGGKRCLAIDQIALTGIVKSDSGMIAVVVNAMNKAYFLRENDPVFNGYVVKITGDSIIFKETIQDKLGKSFEREVTKRIFTPAV